ncbi:MAG: hypothetical protein ABFC84_06990 [Veillonellales bacterium]
MKRILALVFCLLFVVQLTAFAKITTVVSKIGYGIPDQMQIRLSDNFLKDNRMTGNIGIMLIKQCDIDNDFKAGKSIPGYQFTLLTLEMKKTDVLYPIYSNDVHPNIAILKNGEEILITNDKTSFMVFPNGIVFTLKDDAIKEMVNATEGYIVFKTNDSKMYKVLLPAEFFDELKKLDSMDLLTEYKMGKYEKRYGIN